MYCQLIRLDQENAFLQDNLVQNAVSVLCIFPNQNNYIEPDSTLCVVQKPTLLCNAKTDTTISGKLGRTVGFSTRASRAGVLDYTTLLVFVGFYTTGGFYIYLFQLLSPECDHGVGDGPPDDEGGGGVQGDLRHVRDARAQPDVGERDLEVAEFIFRRSGDQEK